MAAAIPQAFKGSVILLEHARKMQAAREERQRKELAAQHARGFAAAQLNRLTYGLRVTAERIDHELRHDLDALRGRSRTLDANNDFAANYHELCETNIIGETAPRLISLVDNQPGAPDTTARQAIQKNWDEWCQRGVCEISGQYSFTEVCQQIARGTPRDGEYCVEIIRGAAARNRFNFALRIIDVDRLATWLNRDAREGVNAIRLGVEVDSDNRPVAYWFNKTDRAGSRGAEPIPADTILHRFRGVRPEQTRGIPWNHASMLSMHYAGEFALSALMAAKAGADTLGFFVTPDGAAPSIGEAAEDEEGARIATSAPGTWETLPEGVDIHTVDSKYPNEVFGPFVKTAHQRMAAGLPGANYPELCNDYEAVNFSSIRAAIVASRDFWRKLHVWFASSWLEPIFAEWLRLGLLSGAIQFDNGSALPATKWEKFKAHAWRFRGWAWVDPLKDIEAAKESLALKITSRSRIAAEAGRDLEDVFDELQTEEKLAEKYSIDLNPPNPANNQSPGSNQP